MRRYNLLMLSELLHWFVSLVEFVTVMWFESLAAARTFAGEDYEVAVVPPKPKRCYRDLMRARRITRLKRTE